VRTRSQKSRFAAFRVANVDAQGLLTIYQTVSEG
jgi:hypothetical protein